MATLKKKKKEIERKTFQGLFLKVNSIFKLLLLDFYVVLTAVSFSVCRMNFSHPRYAAT